MNAPTLLIGLGGAGCKIVDRVARLVTEEQRSNIAFAVFDTDINDLRAIQTRSPFVKTIQTSTNQTVGEYLYRDTHARDTWFPVNAILNGKTLTEGAGQVRSISRLALDTVIRAGKMEPLHEAIQSLYKVEEDKVEQALRVVIVSSLAGGTGSGLILPVALYVRNYLQAHFRQSANITRGFFILPEVFYEVIKGQAERNNLKSNAYATLRELDAFLMKGDATLPAKYAKSVNMQFPKSVSDGYEEYDVRPYDFCFLFDAQNAEGGKLNSFDQYLDHAANCIYAQSIGPMNKRSNSSEDNTIRKLAKERGRNRYAGAGVSMLIYPYEDIRSLLAYKWAKQCVSERWLEYDNRYKELVKDRTQMLEDGIVSQEQPFESFYTNQIEAAAKHDDPFAKAIYRSSGIYENGIRKTEKDRWDVYLDAILAKVKQDLDESSSELITKKKGVEDSINDLGNDWKAYPEAFAEAKEYYQLAVRYAEEASQSIAYSMFKGSIKGADLGQDYKLETYLVDSQNNFLHPNAIRYMLIKILDVMSKEKESIEGKKVKEKKSLDNYGDTQFNNAKTEGVVETVEDLENRANPPFAAFSGKTSDEQEDAKKKIRTYFNNVQKYQLMCAQSKVLVQGIDYIQSLLDAFTGFFNSLDSKVGSLDRSIQELHKKYSDSKGTTVRYVCTSKECLQAIEEKMVYTGSSISIDSKLARSIYSKVQEYALRRDKPNSNRYFNDLFENNIIGYFRDAVKKNYGLELDVDVITAIEKEADYEKLYEDEDDADTLIRQYVVKTINDTRNLSCPFIETPLGEQTDPIDSCTFNDSLKPAKGDESPRAQLVRKELMNLGGEPDEDIPSNTIMFYKSYYGLRANELSKFAPPSKSATHKRNGGEYFKAYYDLIQGIHPKSEESKEISPHIDRWWHIITKMPDLDEDNQRKQEYEIYAAFFWSILCRYIYLTPEGHEQHVYKLRNVLLGMENDSLIVSNGTECDRFYEVLDAISIYPELTRKILDEVDMNIQDDINDNTPLDEGILIKGLKNFSIEEPGIGKDNSPSESIFDIPMLMKKSAIQEMYEEDSVVEMLRVEIEEIKRYLANFCSNKELPDKLKNIILEQFRKHLSSMKKEHELHPTVYRELLFGKCCDTIANALEELGFRRDARQLLDEVAKLSQERGDKLDQETDAELNQ